MPLQLVRRSTTATLQGALILVGLGLNSTIVKGQDAIADSRVRSESPWIRVAIAEGNQKSPTFRRLVEAIDATDGMVYAHEGRCRRSVRACLHLSVGVAGPYRFLRVLVNTRKAPGCELIASLGHELQHVLEVLSDPGVRSTQAMYSFFDRKKPTGWRDAFETDEAEEVGMLVDREICK
jgi:hypothetical protein